VKPFWSALPPDEAAAAREEWEERAAIREFCGGQDRAEAEREAYAEVRARVMGRSDGKEESDGVG
jgi:hypothetical protein